MDLAITLCERHNAAMQSTSTAVEIGARLKATREAFGLNGTAFAKPAGIDQNRYSQYETGKRTLTMTAALALCRVYGLTLDWLFRGDISGLPHAIAIKLTGSRNSSADSPPP